MATKDFRTALSRGFSALRDCGYFAQQNWKCCQTCGCDAVPDEFANHYVFYHLQDAERLRTAGQTYLAWSGDGHEIARILRAEGLAVEWDGSEHTRIW